MKIYVAHASQYDYQKQLYQPLKNSLLWQQHIFILPHEKNATPLHSKKIIAESDIVLAEVSYASTGIGIELGWAESLARKIICLAHADAMPSSALNLLTPLHLRYTNEQDMMEKLQHLLMQLENNTPVSIG